MSGYKLTLADGRWVTAERVTDVIRAVLAQPELEAWKLREAVGYALARPAEMVPPDANAVVSEWETYNLRHSRRGTSVHRLIAEVLRGRGGVLGEAHAGYLAAFLSWREAHPWRPVTVERTVLSDTARIAGTFDAVFMDGSRVVLVDWKTKQERPQGPAWFSEVAQLGAYASMRRWVQDRQEQEERMPRIDTVRVVRLVADGTWTEDIVDIERARRVWRLVRALWKEKG